MKFTLCLLVPTSGPALCPYLFPLSEFVWVGLAQSHITFPSDLLDSSVKLSAVLLEETTNYSLDRLPQNVSVSTRACRTLWECQGIRLRLPPQKEWDRHCRVIRSQERRIIEEFSLQTIPEVRGQTRWSVYTLKKMQLGIPFTYME